MAVPRSGRATLPSSPLPRRSAPPAASPVASRSRSSSSTRRAPRSPRRSSSPSSSCRMSLFHLPSRRSWTACPARPSWWRATWSAARPTPPWACGSCASASRTWATSPRRWPSPASRPSTSSPGRASIPRSSPKARSSGATPCRRCCIPPLRWSWRRWPPCCWTQSVCLGCSWRRACSRWLRRSSRASCTCASTSARMWTNIPLPRGPRICARLPATSSTSAASGRFWRTRPSRTALPRATSPCSSPSSARHPA